MNSGLNHTLANTLLRFIEGSNEEVMLIDRVTFYGDLAIFRGFLEVFYRLKIA